MNDKLVKQYLTSYYEGTSTEEEIKALETFFSRTDMPEQWKDEASHFLQLRRMETIPVPEGLEARLEKSLDAYITKKKKINLKYTTYKITGIAAAILLCIGIAFYQASTKSETTIMADTYSDPEQAAKVASEALTLLSLNLNKGLDRVSDAKKEIQEVNKLINDQLK